MVTITRKNVALLMLKEKWLPIEPAPLYHGDKWFRVLEDIRIELYDGATITIPKGYITDISTGPQVLWSLLPPYGRHTLAAIIHDYLYTDKPYGKTVRTWLKTELEMLRWSHTLKCKPVGMWARFILLLIGGWTVYFGLIKIKKQIKKQYEKVDLNNLDSLIAELG
jgi:hypothetical protein